LDSNGESVYSAAYENAYTEMLTDSIGLTLYQNDSVFQFWITRNRDSTWQPLGVPTELNPISGFASDPSTLFAIVTKDSTVTVTTGKNFTSWKEHEPWHQFLARSTDSGYNWSYSYPVDTNSWKGLMSFLTMQKGCGVGHYFLIGGRITDTTSGQLTPIDDYLETTDGGATWTIGSTVSGGRLRSISEPGKDSIWALVGRVPSVRTMWPHDYPDIFFGTPTKIVDSIFFSSDGGKTWLKDGTSFAGDTIVKMQWLTPTNGYVVAERGDTSFLYRFNGFVVDSVKDTTKEAVGTQIFRLKSQHFRLRRIRHKALFMLSQRSES